MNWKHWIKGLAAAFITGVSSSGLSALGISGAQSVGVQIEQLKPKQLISVALCGGVVGALAYLKQSPVPTDDQAEPGPNTKPGPNQPQNPS